MALLLVVGLLLVGVPAARPGHSVRASSAGATAAANPIGELRRPVLVELFTSEGCSSCPPADELLRKLDRTQPLNDARIVVLSEHVDYWDDGKWRDPFSSHAYSERQDAYASRFGLDTVYTPQMVVDGRFEAVGSNEQRALRVIESAAQTDKAIVALSATRFNGDAVVTHIEAGALPSIAGSDSADIEVALADESDESHVGGGENGGRTLMHVAVLRALKQVARVDKTQGFVGDLSLPVEHSGARAVRIVAIVQVPAGRVWGVSSAQVQGR